MSASAVVGVGGSAGSMSLLTSLVAGLPEDIPAAVVVTMHLAESRHSALPNILGRSGRLPVVHPADGRPLADGNVFVAPPGRHLVVGRNDLHLSAGPKVNRFRPAVDVMFASMATNHGPAAAAVVLSGMLDDGAAGCALISAEGGRVAVQDPADARFASMPRAALAAAPDAIVVDEQNLAKHVVALAQQCAAAPAAAGASEEVAMTDSSDVSFLRSQETRLTRLACPDCGGVLAEVRMPTVSWFQCHVGHQYGPASLAAAQREATERKLWAAAAALEEEAVSLRHLADLADRTPRPASAAEPAVTDREPQPVEVTEDVDASNSSELRRRAAAAGDLAQELQQRLSDDGDD